LSKEQEFTEAYRACSSEIFEAKQQTRELGVGNWTTVWFTLLDISFGVPSETNPRDVGPSQRVQDVVCSTCPSRLEPLRSQFIGMCDNQTGKRFSLYEANRTHCPSRGVPDV
jgi:hypothetical protein